jgi:hypothetical protein
MSILIKLLMYGVVGICAITGFITWCLAIKEVIKNKG